ncbi:MAG: malonyl-ACP O-methyltransferase BioC [Rikenellaceae bacterium]
MDKELIALRFAKAASTYQSESMVQRQIAQRLIEELLAFVGGCMPQRILEVGCGTGHLSHRLYEEFSPDALYLNDLCEEMGATLSSLTEREGVEFAAYDADNSEAALPSGLDLVASSSAIQWFEDLEGFFRRAAESLKSGGFMALSTFGGDNLFEVTTLSGVGLDYPQREEIEKLAEKEFEVLYSREQHITLHFDSPSSVLRHLKLTGVNSVEATSWTRGRLTEFLRDYSLRFPLESGGGVSLTYNPIYLILKRK